MRPVLSVHAKNALILTAALFGALPFGSHAVMSLALGGGMQVINLRALERGVSAMLGGASSGRAGGLRALLSLRWVLFLGAVVFALLVLPLEPIAFLVGLSTVVPAVIWHGFDTAHSRASGDA